jgi:hypothetical protein
LVENGIVFENFSMHHFGILAESSVENRVGQSVKRKAISNPLGEHVKRLARESVAITDSDDDDDDDDEGALLSKTEERKDSFGTL